MARIQGPVWIVIPDVGPEHPIAPGGPGDAHPEHPIVLPPDTPTDPPSVWEPVFPTNPIVIPDPGGGGERPDHTLPGDLPHPDQGLPGDQPQPEHPIVLPPDAVWPGDPAHPTHPIAPGGGEPTHPIAPGGSPGEPTHPIAPGGGPSHPIVLPTPPDGGGEQVGGLEFYQRKTLGINWDKSFDECAVVSIQAGTTADDLVTVRTVANDGSSSVTYPQDFKGSVLIRVNGMDGYLEGTTTVK
jgi:hypothetical protein